MKSIWILLALAISAFAIGSTEFISIGLLPLIKQEFNVSLYSAGLTVSLYALGVTIGALILTAITSGMQRKKVLILVMCTFIIGNFIAAFSTTFNLLLIGRIVSAFAHGVFMSIAALIATDVVKPNKRASAIAIMFSGLTIATITGVPLGTWIGEITSWRISFVFIACIGIIGLITNMILIPENLSKSNKITLKDMKTVLTNPRMLLIFIITAIGYGGTFVMYTYLSPILQQVLHFSPSTIVILLVFYGIFVAIGNVIGGKTSNNNTLYSLFIMFMILSFLLLLLYFVMNSSYISLFVIFSIGLFMFMNVPGLQLFAVQTAEKYISNATLMASALNISSFNIGIFAGSYIGGMVVQYYSLGVTTIYASVMVMIATFIIAIWLFTDKHYVHSIKE